MRHFHVIFHIKSFEEVLKMDTLKKLFPYSFKAKNTIGALVLNIIAYIVVGAIVSALIGILSGIPIVGIIVR